MRRKFKDFLNKRVISGTLSAAIAFNMAAYIPMGAFAHDETSAETTADLNEINISGQLMSNGYLAMNFNDYSSYETFANLDVGEQIPCGQTLTSWSDRIDVAERFAGSSADQAGDPVIMICDETNTAVGVQHISKFGTAESEVLAPSTTSWTVTNTETMTKYDHLLKEGKLSEFANVDELSEQYVTIISVVEN